MGKTYWDKPGKHQAQYDRLLELMPNIGSCSTVAGELIRAVTRLRHDLYNNGMGNNTSGAVNMLRELGTISEDTWAIIHPYTRGRLYEGEYGGDSLLVAIESAVNSTVEHILAHPELETTPNTVDMFDWTEDDEIFCEDCGDSKDDTPWGGWGHTCRGCEEQREEEEEELQRQDEEEEEDA